MMKHGWSLSTNKWRLLEDVMKQLSSGGTCIKLDARSAWRVPTSSGVYIICAHPPAHMHFPECLEKRFYNVIYAGKANDLQQRFKQHANRRGKFFRAFSVFQHLDFWHFECTTARLRYSEQALIQVFRPSENQINSLQGTIGPPVPA